MSKPNEPKEFKVTITVIDEQGSSLNRNYIYGTETNYNEEVADLIETFIEAENI